MNSYLYESERNPKCNFSPPQKKYLAILGKVLTKITVLDDNRTQAFQPAAPYST
jgi:hypothetical protein